jgi:hypothetical protein
MLVAGYNGGGVEDDIHRPFEGSLTAGRKGMAVADDAPGDVKPARERPWWRGPYLLYVIFVHTPLSITAICVAAVFKQGLVPWAGVVLGGGAIFADGPGGLAGRALGQPGQAGNGG